MLPWEPAPGRSLPRHVGEMHSAPWLHVPSRLPYVFTQTSHKHLVPPPRRSPCFRRFLFLNSNSSDLSDLQRTPVMPTASRQCSGSLQVLSWPAWGCFFMLEGGATIDRMISAKEHSAQSICCCCCGKALQKNLLSHSRHIRKEVGIWRGWTCSNWIHMKTLECNQWPTFPWQ